MFTSALFLVVYTAETRTHYLATDRLSSGHSIFHPILLGTDCLERPRFGARAKWSFVGLPGCEAGLQPQSPRLNLTLLHLLQRCPLLKSSQKRPRKTLLERKTQNPPRRAIPPPVNKSLPPLLKRKRPLRHPSRHLSKHRQLETRVQHTARCIPARCGRAPPGSQTQASS